MAGEFRRRPPDYKIPENASFTEAVHYAKWYSCDRNDPRHITVTADIRRYKDG